MLPLLETSKQALLLEQLYEKKKKIPLSLLPAHSLFIMERGYNLRYSGLFLPPFIKQHLSGEL